MAWNAADLASLETAIKSGVLTVVYDGPPRRQITYQDLDALKRLRDEMVREIAASSTTRVTYRLAGHSKGL